MMYLSALQRKRIDYLKKSLSSPNAELTNFDQDNLIDLKQKISERKIESDLIKMIGKPSKENQNIDDVVTSEDTYDFLNYLFLSRGFSESFSSDVTDKIIKHFDN